MKTKNTSQNAVLEAAQNTIILCEGRGDYLTGLRADGEIMGGSKADAIRYTAEEAAELIESLGRGFSAETTSQAGERTLHFTHLGKLELGKAKEGSERISVSSLATEICRKEGLCAVNANHVKSAIHQLLP